MGSPTAEPFQGFVVCTGILPGVVAALQPRAEISERLRRTLCFLCVKYLPLWLELYLQGELDHPRGFTGLHDRLCRGWRHGGTACRSKHARPDARRAR